LTLARIFSAQSIAGVISAWTAAVGSSLC